jgi:hypothetical protein
MLTKREPSRPAHFEYCLTSGHEPPVVDGPPRRTCAKKNSEMESLSQ